MAKKNGNGHQNGHSKVTAETLETRLRNLATRMKVVSEKSKAQCDESANLLRDVRTQAATNR